MTSIQPLFRLVAVVLIPAGLAAQQPAVARVVVTLDGRRLIGTNKRDASVSVYDVATGRELARIPNWSPQG